jgi:hypothetical protein
VSSTPPDATTLARTRDSWHRVAEHVLAAAQYVDSAEITLRPRDGGFQTTHPLAGVRHLAVDSTELVVLDHRGARRTPLTTLREVASFAGVHPGLSPTVYPPATSADLDAPLAVDAAAAQLLAGWYLLGDAALQQLGAELGTSDLPILWPEHFDLGITVADVNYGVSPGDEHVGEPYLYVGPHGGPPERDTFWNATFGAYRTHRQIQSVEDAVAFFTEGRDRLTAQQRGSTA